MLSKAVGSDWKGKLSPVLYLIAICATYLNTYISGGIYVLVAAIWLIPDRRIERIIKADQI